MAAKTDQCMRGNPEYIRYEFTLKERGKCRVQTEQ